MNKKKLVTKIVDDLKHHVRSLDEYVFYFVGDRLHFKHQWASLEEVSIMSEKAFFEGQSKEDYDESISQIANLLNSWNKYSLPLVDGKEKEKAQELKLQAKSNKLLRAEISEMLSTKEEKLGKNKLIELWKLLNKV